MALTRSVVAEALDGLAANDAAAMRSRRDLRRVHRVMGTRTILLEALSELMSAKRPAAPLRLLELGAGDGSLMLGVARALAKAWPPVELTLLDRQALVDRATLRAYAEVGWTAVPRVVDVLDWAAGRCQAMPIGGQAARWDLIVVNLFLHHFEGPPLDAVLHATAARSDCLFACEPRRSALALAFSHLVGAMGVNAVTRQDAVLSVHAGFRDHELTALWPARGLLWQLREYRAGLFSHCFLAQRLGAH
jgi:hypothetical protein